MLDKSGIIKRLLFADSQAKNEVAALKGLDSPTLFHYEETLKKYILYKYLLDDETDIKTDKMNELAELSVKKAGRLNPKEMILLDISRHCGATSSAMTKKVLLFMSIQEDFHVDLTNVDTANIKTINDLAKIIYEQGDA